MERASLVHDFWLDGVDARGVPNPACMARWFAGGSAVDEEIRRRFLSDVERALAGELESWAASRESRFALVVLLDQFSRNLFRDSARAYSGDPRALALVKECVDQGLDREHPAVERYFLYLPFEHSEDPDDQHRSVSLFQSLVDETPADARAYLEGALEWALRHQVVIDRFGRFPSRNPALGRESTPEELEFLERTPSGF